LIENNLLHHNNLAVSRVFAPAVSMLWNLAKGNNVKYRKDLCKSAHNNLTHNGE
jgi:hypothetical protein